LLAGLLRNLRGGLELALLRRRWPPRFVVSFDQVALLLAVNLALWALLDFLHAPSHAPLALDGLFGWACYLLLALAACALTARAESRAAETRPLLVTALAASPFVLLAFSLVSELALSARAPLIFTLLGLAYLVCLAVRVLGAAYGPVHWRAALTAIVLVLAAPSVGGVLDLDTRLWVPEGQTPAQEDDDADQAEALYYDQPSRIAAAVARVAPSQQGKPGVYFVGFAGDGSQGVFRRETLFANEVFGARFGSLERSVLLVNDVDDRDSYPLASVSGLEQTLKVLAARMDVEQDVLVLFLSSHGSEDGLEVENGSLPLAQLAPEDVREALDAAGVRWRVIVVSACHSGVFVDALKGETTAIVTASDAAHDSFGCDDERELTWFGEAFLKDSLPVSASLQDAFHKAAQLIAQREDSEHQVHSNPQLYVGGLMQRKLAELPPAKPERDSRAYSVRR
jgi:Peptidase C13 family